MAGVLKGPMKFDLEQELDTPPDVSPLELKHRHHKHSSSKAKAKHPNPKACHCAWHELNVHTPSETVGALFASDAQSQDFSRCLFLQEPWGSIPVKGIAKSLVISSKVETALTGAGAVKPNTSLMKEAKHDGSGGRREAVGSSKKCLVPAKRETNSEVKSHGDVTAKADGFVPVTQRNWRVR